MLLHTLTNGQYGFHRDELAPLDDARYPAWGYVAYPPVTPFLARVALELVGPSLAGVRFFVALAQAAALVLTGLMAHQLGGRRAAQIVAALAVAVAPVSLAAGGQLRRSRRHRPLWSGPWAAEGDQRNRFVLAARIRRSTTTDSDRGGNIAGVPGAEFRVLQVGRSRHQPLRGGE